MSNKEKIYEIKHAGIIKRFFKAIGHSMLVFILIISGYIIISLFLEDGLYLNYTASFTVFNSIKFYQAFWITNISSVILTFFYFFPNTKYTYTLDKNTNNLIKNKTKGPFSKTTTINLENIDHFYTEEKTRNPGGHLYSTLYAAFDEMRDNKKIIYRSGKKRRVRKVELAIYEALGIQ